MSSKLKPQNGRLLDISDISIAASFETLSDNNDFTKKIKFCEKIEKITAPQMVKRNNTS